MGKKQNLLAEMINFLVYVLLYCFTSNMYLSILNKFLKIRLQKRKMA